MSMPPSPYGPQGPYGPLPGQPPGAPPPAPRRNKGKFWLGVVLSLPALLVVAFFFGGVVSAVDAAGAPAELTSLAGLVAGLLVLTGVVALIVVERTRWIGVGLIAGAAIWAIVAAGACIALLVAVSNSYNA